MLSLPTEPVLCLLLGWASVSDMRCRRIPNACSVGGSVVLCALLLVSGRAVLGDVLWGAALLAGFGSVALFRPQSLGMGDAKLVGLLGVALGPMAAPAVVAGLGCAGAAGAVIAVREGPSAAREATLAMAPHFSFGTALVCGLIA